MKAYFVNKWPRRVAGIFIFCAICLNGAVLFGGNSPLDNVFTSSDQLPSTLQRVVVLPLAHEDSVVDLSSGCETLFPVLQAELIKTKKFEVVIANPKMVQSLTGQPTWTGAEVLPPDFLAGLQRAYGCDAVLFCQLSTYHAYPPMVIGWRLKLVDTGTQKVIWASDMVFDAGDPVVCKNAELYQKRQQGTQKPSGFMRRVWTWLNRQPEPATDDQWTVLNSPRYFGEFSLSTMLQTLPKR